LRIGVYVCECGINIGATVDAEKVAHYAGTLPNVKVSRYYKYMCSDPGQELIKKDIKELNLDRVVVASCSPRMHETTFRSVVEDCGMNPYCFEMANIREQCSWVHTDKEKATKKAIAIVASAVAKASYLEPLKKKEVPVTPQALVVGGGIAGIQAALEIGNMGYKTYLVERTPSIGGKMAQLDKTFPTLDCSACILTPKMVDAARHPNIELLTYSEVVDVEGYVGNFKIKVKKKPRYIDSEKCTGCGSCIENCPVQFRPQISEVISVREEMEKEDIEKLDQVLGKHEGKKGDLVPIMQEVNNVYNYLPEYALKYISEELDIPLSTVFHVATFYKSFTLEPRGRHHIKVCTGTACHVRGASRVLEAVERELHIKPGETSADGEFSLETVNCLGACAMGPVIVIDDVYYSTTPSKIHKLLDKVCKIQEVVP
jgi:NADH:ubiquinone oxidoreductase subunit E/NAD-dependent dihydropyrimidine dehydrogenase PreA subunit